MPVTERPGQPPKKEGKKTGEVIDPCTRPLQKTQKTQRAGHPNPFLHLLRSGAPGMIRAAKRNNPQPES